MEHLGRIGCDVTARLDPLVPELTDASPAIDELLARIATAGIRFVAASYMFLRPAFGKRVASALEVLDTGQRTDEWPYQEFTDGCSGGKSIGEDERKARFQLLSRIARQHGLTLAPCACKNPGLTDGSCHIAGSTPVQTPAQAELPFR